MNLVTVREYALLTIGDPIQGSLDEANISATAFDHLCNLASSFRRGGATLLHVEGRIRLKLDNFVGVIETPCGTRLEILPKHIDNVTDKNAPRRLLCKMLETFLDLPNRDVGKADLARYKKPLLEWIIQQFLAEFETLITKGLRFDYLQVEEEQKFLRGQLDIAKRIRQPAGREHLFPIRHDIYTPDRAENRLLRVALEKICRVTQDPDNWRLAQELRLLTGDIPASRQTQQDFKKWHSGRLLAHYQPIRPWCELVLGEYMPVAVQGEWRGISFLFPMEKLFESYVAANLRRNLVKAAKLSTQAKSEYLCNHHAVRESKARPRFQLRPDLLIKHNNENNQKTVLDTKWKRLDVNETRYGLKDSDFQQMFAYSHFYLNHEGCVILIYPYWEGFREALPVFEFRVTDRSANLWVIPFDLENDSILIPETLEYSVKDLFKPEKAT